jgi:hypothetical protein
VDLAKGGEPLPVMPSEVAVERPVGVQPEKLPDDLDGQDLRVRKLRSGTAPSNTPTLEMIVDEAEDAKTMKVLRSTNGRPPFVLDGLEHHRA